MQTIFDHLLPGKPVWDFCCDHGYMGLNAYESGLFPEVYFVDQVPHIMAQLEQRFQAEYYRPEGTSKAHFLSHAGEDVAQELCGSVVIAGVGAYTIFKIIQGLTEKELLKADRLILGPQRDEEKLLKLLHELPHFHYSMPSQELSLLERGRVRKLLIFDKKL